MIEIHARSCTVTYQPPRRDDGASVTGYILERRTPGPVSEWIRVNDTPVTDRQYTIDNLTPATEYEFRVAAVNKRGMSDFSLTSRKIMTATVLQQVDCISPIWRADPFGPIPTKNDMVVGVDDIINQSNFGLNKF